MSVSNSHLKHPSCWPPMAVIGLLILISPEGANLLALCQPLSTGFGETHKCALREIKPNPHRMPHKSFENPNTSRTTQNAKKTLLEALRASEGYSRKWGAAPSCTKGEFCARLLGVAYDRRPVSRADGCGRHGGRDALHDSRQRDNTSPLSQSLRRRQRPHPAGH